MNLSQNPSPTGTSEAVSIQKLNGYSGHVKTLNFQGEQQLDALEISRKSLLICITGEVLFQNENLEKELLRPGNCLSLDPRYKISLTALIDSRLFLIQ